MGGGWEAAHEHCYSAGKLAGKPSPPHHMQFLLKTHRNSTDLVRMPAAGEIEKETKDIKRKKKGGYNKIRAGGGWVELCAIS